ncbi:unnamed protein product, partial [Aphis gossypii]
CTFSCVFFCTQPLLIFCVCLSLSVSPSISVRSVCHTDVHIYIYILYVCMCTKTNEMAREEKKEKKKENYHLYTSPHRPSPTPFADIIISPAFLRDTKHILYSFRPVSASVSVPTTHAHFIPRRRAATATNRILYTASAGRRVYAPVWVYGCVGV